MDLTANNITDLSPLSSLKLNGVYIDYNKITDISPLLAMDSLQYVIFGINDKTAPWVPATLNHNNIPSEQLKALSEKCTVKYLETAADTSK